MASVQKRPYIDLKWLSTVSISKRLPTLEWLQMTPSSINSKMTLNWLQMASNDCNWLTFPGYSGWHTFANGSTLLRLENWILGWTWTSQWFQKAFISNQRFNDSKKKKRSSLASDFRVTFDSFFFCWLLVDFLMTLEWLLADLDWLLTTFNDLIWWL